MRRFLLGALCWAACVHAEDAMMAGKFPTMLKRQSGPLVSAMRTARGAASEDQNQSRGVGAGLDRYLADLIHTSQRLKADPKRLSKDEIASVAHWIHDWTLRYPQHLVDSALARTLPNHLERVRQAATQVVRATSSKSPQRIGLACQQLQNEVSRFCKAHNHQSRAWVEETNALPNGSPERPVEAFTQVSLRK